MQIRTKLTLTFISIVAVTIIVSSIFIYLFSANYRSDEFYQRLSSKANSMAKILINADEIDLNLLRLIENTGPANLPDEQITIFNQNNEIIFESKENKKISIDAKTLDLLKEKSEIKHKIGEFEIYGVKLNGHNGNIKVFAAAIDKFGYSKLENLKYLLFINFSLIILVIALVAWLFAGNALSPISKIIEQVENISENNLNARLKPSKNKDELHKLSVTFNKMLERIELAFILQKNFVANASHELRTPLTAIRGQMEVILLKDREKSEYITTIESVMEDIKNLSIITNRLLSLAQATADRKDLDFQKLRIDDLLWQTQTDITKFNPDFNVKIEFKKLPETEDDFTIEGNEQLLKTAINNIIENGCKFSKFKTVEVELDFDIEKIYIDFTDQGIGISEKDLEHIFEPFYRTKNAIRFPGYGLGLSLTQKIINLHQGKILVKSELKKFTTFQITLPRIQG